MKIRLSVFFFLAFIGLLTLSGNKNGRASQSGAGNTGAPGDQTLNGAPLTCTGCHDDNAFNSIVFVQVLDTGGVAITHYTPGRLYNARVSVNASGTGLSGYGFQMIALRDTGNIDLDGFSDINPNNYKIATINNGRTYAEHANTSASNIFNVRWTAPAAGTGSVTFYAAGNAVNGNNNSDGDGASNTSLRLFEEITLSSGDEQVSAVPLVSVSPNPVSDVAQLELNLQQAGQYQLTAYNLSGSSIWSSALNLPAGISNYQIPTENWEAGTYYLSVNSMKYRKIVKILKL
ncbi:MAG: T9SS type A sorting domain-containing protein [Lewinellaceae bacterium]|nr:T9SS type A sorting domain-containing protein [Lewinellaceae bacterium]